MRTPRDILRDFRNGDRLDDAELKFLFDEMRKLASLSSDYGDIFALQAHYAARVALDCESYLKARREHAAKPAH